MREGARSCREGAGNGRDARVEPLEWPPAPGRRRSRGTHLLPPRPARPGPPAPARRPLALRALVKKAAAAWSAVNPVKKGGVELTMASARSCQRP